MHYIMHLNIIKENLLQSAEKLGIRQISVITNKIQIGKHADLVGIELYAYNGPINRYERNPECLLENLIRKHHRSNKEQLKMHFWKNAKNRTRNNNKKSGIINGQLG